jgi:hypothetical protein
LPFLAGGTTVCVEVRRTGFADQGLVALLIAQREDVVAAQGEIVEAGGVTVPSRHLDFLGAHDMDRGAHLHAALAERPFDERHFQLDSCSGLEISRRQKIDAARTDVAGDEGDGNRFGAIPDTNQAYRQRKRGTRVTATLLRHSDSVCGHTSKTTRSRFS